MLTSVSLPLATQARLPGQKAVSRRPARGAVRVQAAMNDPKVRVGRRQQQQAAQPAACGLQAGQAAGPLAALLGCSSCSAARAPPL